jgi:phosphoribosylamine--glycine ligase
LFACPGNPGMAEICASAAGDPLAYAEYIGADLTVVGPEAPLAQGIVDRFRSAGKLIVGPVQAAARLEASKSYAKEIMQRAGVPTAKSITAASVQEALGALKHFPLPVVLKADGLAAGKGVVIAHTREEAESAARQLLQLAPPLVIEEFLDGEEVSFIVLSDGRRSLAFDATQDHKAVHDGDRGPNTGGMGAYCDGRILDRAEKERVMDTIIEPVIATMRASGTPFTGFLYAGLMMTAAGARVLEFNARLGDPETQVLMHRMEGDFAAPLLAAAGGDLGASAFSWHGDPSVCVVLAASGYPGDVRSGDLITGIEEAPATIFQAGTRRTARGLETSGGRVLGVTASGNDLETAIRNAYAAAEKIRFDGMHYRKDIGAKGLKRWRA